MVVRNDIMNRREEIRRIAEAHGAHDLRLFGSILHKDGPANDLDLLVRMDPNRSLLDRIALMQALEDLLSCSVDVVNDRALDPLLRDTIQAEALPL